MSFEKIVKLACKPKNAPPKAKYLDPIINATYSDDGSVQDICRALSLRLREPNATVVFKALLVLHSMVRSGATDNVLSFLCQQDLLRLKNVVGQSWDGYAPPQNIGCYAQYLDCRIRGYRELRHDPIRVQAENNRMSRLEGQPGARYDGASSRARKLKSLTVDKGLLREVREVQKMVNAVTLCKFYEDDLSDECTVMAFRMLVKDLLVLVQAVNEGVVNLLEHYFEMAKTDAQEALGIYKSFCKQNDRVVEYLNAARRLHHVVDVPVPNLKHAPVSLVKALEEYLNDPNFEQNRLEYKQNMSAADIPATTGGSSSTPAAAKPSSPNESRTSAPQKQEGPSTSSVPPPKAQTTVNQSIQDFFASIENEQGNGPANNNFMMNPYGQQNNMLQQQPMVNPFRQSMMAPQMTGFPAQTHSLGMNSWAQHSNGRMVPQSTGFLQPQQTPFLQPQQTAFMAPQQTQQQQSPFLQPQSTGFLQPAPTSPPAQPQNAFGSMSAASNPTGMQPMAPQVTGPNPFRQSMMFPQSTGAAFQPMPTGGSSSGFSQNSVAQPPPHPQANSVNIAKPLSVQPTGSKNPFALPSDHERKPSPQPAGPSLYQLSQMKASTMPTGGGNTFDSVFGNNSNAAGSNTFTNEFGALTVHEPARNQGSPFSPAQHNNTVSGAGTAMSDLASAMSDLASAFTFSSNNDSNKQTSSFGNGLSAFTTGISSNSGTTGSSSSPSGIGQQGPSAFGASGSTPLQPQPTGFAGSSVKPFKPSSNFGSSLVETLPPLPASSTGTPVGNQSSNTGGGGGGFGQTFSSAPTSPLATQATGFNPFGSAHQQQSTGMAGGSSFMSIFGQQQQAAADGGSVFGNSNWQR